MGDMGAEAIAGNFVGSRLLCRRPSCMITLQITRLACNYSDGDAGEGLLLANQNLREKTGLTHVDLVEHSSLHAPIGLWEVLAGHSCRSSILYVER